MVIPKSYKVGGQDVEVRMVERCTDDCIGQAHLAEGYIEVANVFNRDRDQSDSSKYNTFLHELVHTILQTMGEDELNKSEKFVCTFSSFLCEALTSSKYD